MGRRDVVVSIGAKSDGLIPLNEFRDLPDMKPGDEVEVYIEEQENSRGQLVLSHKKANLVRGWEKIQAAAEDRSPLEAFVKRRTKGGLIVDIQGIEAFLPGSQIDIKPVRDFDAYVEKPIDVAVVKINHANDNVVVSHKALIEKSLERQQSESISNLEQGQVLEGTVKNMTSFGVFVDLGGVDGLLHITDISWSRVVHPEDVLTLGEKVRVVVTDFNEDRRRISLGMKQLTPHPWEALPSDIGVGTKVKGRIVNLAYYGAFLEIMPGIEGLIHISEMMWSQCPRSIKELVKVGDELEAVVLTLDRELRKMSLGVKQLKGDPWASGDLLKRYAVGSTHQGIVRNMTHFGGFIELEEGIDGLLHVSDLSWTKKVSHPSEVLESGKTIEVMVLEVDPSQKRLALGLKQLEQNPWDAHEKTYQVGTEHKGTITKFVDKGALVALPDDVEGFVPKRHLAKKEGKEAVVGEELLFQVIEFSRSNRRVVLSHTATFSQIENTPSKSSSSSAPKPHTTIEEKSTLGDLDALADLKERMDGSSEE